MLIYGMNAVMEALRAGRVRSLRVADRDDARMAQLLELAQDDSGAGAARDARRARSRDP